jgi:hypothetical protein
MTDEQHDFSRVDAWSRSRQRVAFLSAVWRPMLAGAAGAALVVAAVYVTLPKFSVREVTVDHVVTRDVPLNNPVPHDVPFDVPVPRVVPPPPVAANPPAPRSNAPRTPSEKKFTETPEWKGTIYKGRITGSRGGGALSFIDPATGAEGEDFSPAHIDPSTGKTVRDPGQSFDSDGLVGLLGMCRQDQDGGLWSCVALMDGRETPVAYKQKTAHIVPRAPAPSPPARYWI